MTSSAEQIRDWNGPALLGYGFRLFFLGAAVFAGVAMAVWIGALTNLWTVPSAFGPVEYGTRMNSSGDISRPSWPASC
jgi:uncharacterized protein involved in response to NO